MADDTITTEAAFVALFPSPQEAEEFRDEVHSSATSWVGPKRRRWARVSYRPGSAGYWQFLAKELEESETYLLYHGDGRLAGEYRLPSVAFTVLDDRAAATARYWQFLADRRPQSGAAPGPDNPPEPIEVLCREDSWPDDTEPQQILCYPKGEPGFNYPAGTIVARHWNGNEAVFTPPLDLGDVARVYGVQAEDFIKYLTTRPIDVHTDCTPDWEDELLEGFEVMSDDETSFELALWLSIGVWDPWGEWRLDDYYHVLMYHDDGRKAAVKAGSECQGADIAITADREAAR